MSDEFNFGEPAKHPARLGRSKPRHSQRSFDPRLVWVAAGLVAAATLAFVLLRSADEAGHQLGDANEQAVSEIDRANDAAAQGTLGRAAVVAQTLHAEQGTFTADLATLSGFDPGLHLTSGPSGDAMTVSYAAGPNGFGAAVESDSGTCWWLSLDGDGVTSYGSGTPCTGQAAMAASDPSW
jgi:hypothetical protein